LINSTHIFWKKIYIKTIGHSSNKAPIKVDTQLSVSSPDLADRKETFPLPSGDSHFFAISSNNHLLCLLRSSVGNYWSNVDISLSSIESESEVLALDAFERTTRFNFSDIVAGKLKSVRGQKRTGFSNLIVAMTVAQVRLC
jgi:hypothetical protein